MNTLQLQAAQEEILSHFADYDVEGTSIDMQGLFEEFSNLPEQDVVVLCCNLEDQDTMRSIIEGDFSEMDPYEEDQFNDDYWSMSEDMNLNGESEEDEDEDED